MITLCLIAVGFSVLVFRQALHGAGEGHEDELGFHAAPTEPTHPRHSVRSSPAARPNVYTVPRASPWLRLPVHGPDEVDLMVARAVIRMNSRSPVLE